MRLLIGLLAILVIVVIYFLPTIVAYKRKYKNRMSVLIVDLFLGWTLIGWVVALALSFINDIDENEKPSDKTVKTVAKIGTILLVALCVLGAIGNTLRDIKISKYQSEYKEYTENLSEFNNDNSNTEQLSIKTDNPAALLFQPDKLLELKEEERKEILSKLSNENIVLDNKDVNARDKDGKTVLMYASQYCNDPAIIEALIKGGADVNAEKGYNDNALLYASKYNNNPEIIETLIMNGAIVDDDTLRTASRYTDNPEVIETIIAKSSKKLDMDYPLLNACDANKNIDVIKTIIKHGGNLKQKFYNTLDDGATILMHASAGNENPKVIEFLIDNGLDVKAKNNAGKTVLMYACDNLNEEIIDVIISKGGDINSKNNSGKTALMYASEEKGITRVSALLKHNPDINATDNNGKNALMLTYEILKNDSNLAKYIQEAMNLDDIRKLLIDNGININAADNTGKTVLMYACEFVRDTAPIDELLEKGAIVDAKDKKGNTVYDYARRNKNIMFSKIKAVLDKYQNTNNEN